MYQYILFDLDGTLSDPKQGICKSVQYALADAGIAEPNLDVLEPFIGPPLKDSFMEFYGMTAEQAETGIAKYRERFETTGLYENEIYQGIPDLLRKLKAAGKQLAVASSKPTVFVDRILDYFEIKEFFEIVVGSELDGQRSRKEEVVEETLKRLLNGDRSKYDKCVMVGDRRFDIEGAAEFGLDSIGVTYGYGGKEELKMAGATKLADSVEELEHILLAGAPKAPGSLTVQKPQGSSFYKVWQILFPILLYWMICNFIILAGAMAVQVFFEAKGMAVNELPAEQISRISVYLNSLAIAAAIPVLARAFAKDSRTAGVSKEKAKFEQCSQRKKALICFLTIILGASLALGLNIVISHIDFSDLAQGFEEVATMQFSVPLLGGIIIYGVVTPIAEEILFRGLVFKRVEKYFNTTIAVVMSAFIFGAYHGNYIQFIYGFLLGIAIVLCYKQFDTILVPILLHSAANICVFVVTSSPNLQSVGNHILNGVIFIGIAMITWLQMVRMKKTV